MDNLQSCQQPTTPSTCGNKRENNIYLSKITRTFDYFYMVKFFRENIDKSFILEAKDI